MRIPRANPFFPDLNVSVQHDGLEAAVQLKYVQDAYRGVPGKDVSHPLLADLVLATTVELQAIADAAQMQVHHVLEGASPTVLDAFRNLGGGYSVKAIGRPEERVYLPQEQEWYAPDLKG